ncbi:MAG TPA: hypothetical protein VGL86_06445 [Polyangia bacterium]
MPALDRVPLTVAQRSADDVWIAGGALGSGGDAMILHYDGHSWTRTDPGTDATLWWVDAPDASTRWFVGERGTVLRGDALTAVSVPTTSTLYGVWQSPAGTVWIVGGVPDLSGVILRSDGGSAFADVTPAGSDGAYFKVWGASDDDVWICGQAGVLVHWDGSALAAVDSGQAANVPLFTVAGRAHDDVYAVGGLGTAVVLHYDGSSWSALGDAVLATMPGLTGASVDSDGTVVIVGGSGAKLRGKPGALVDETAFATREDLHATSIVGGQVFAVGGSYLAPAPAPRTGVVVHFGGDVSSTVK